MTSHINKFSEIIEFFEIPELILHISSFLDFDSIIRLSFVSPNFLYLLSEDKLLSCKLREKLKVYDIDNLLTKLEHILLRDKEEHDKEHKEKHEENTKKKEKQN